MPYSGQTVGIDNIEIPTGTILGSQQYSVNDFWSAPKQLGSNVTSPEIVGNCGFNCSGYDNCFLVNRDQDGPYDWREKGPVVTLSSPWSGIQIDVFTDQEALQVYSCNNQNGSRSNPVWQTTSTNPRFQELSPSRRLKAYAMAAAHARSKSMDVSYWRSRTGLMVLISRSGVATNDRYLALKMIHTY